MSHSEFEDLFRILLDRYGRAELQRRLELLVDSLDVKGARGLAQKRRKYGGGARRIGRDALEYVNEMELPRRRKEILLDLAARFQRKEFLPAAGDVRNFFESQGMDSASVKSRSAVAQRLFFFLSSLTEERLLAIAREPAYCGPVKLEPLASAIKRSSRARHGSGDGPGSTGSA